MKFEDMINKIINCDCYEMIKNIPDKSVDLVYIDIPYLFADGGSSTSPLSQRIKKIKTTRSCKYNKRNRLLNIK